MALENLATVITGKGKKVAEYLSTLSPMIEHAPAVVCNNGDQHKSDAETSLAQAHRTRLNQGVPESTNTYREVVSSTTLYEASYGIANNVLRRKAGTNEEKQAEFLARKHRANLASITRLYEQDVIYGNNKNDARQFNGLHNIYSYIDTIATSPGFQVIDAEGTGANLTSLDLILWSPDGVHLIYPDCESSTAITTTHDSGINSFTDEDGISRNLAGQKWLWECQLGIHVEDYRAFIRIANIDIDVIKNWKLDSYTGPNIVDLLRKGYTKMGLNMRRGLAGDMSQVKVYMNEDLYDIFDSMYTRGFDNVRINTSRERKEIDGQAPVGFRKADVDVCDAILTGEERVVAAA